MCQSATGEAEVILRRMPSGRRGAGDDTVATSQGRFSRVREAMTRVWRESGARRERLYCRSEVWPLALVCAGETGEMMPQDFDIALTRTTLFGALLDARDRFGQGSRPSKILSGSR